MPRVLGLCVLFAASLSLLACAGTRPADLGVSGVGLAPCPASPNCLSSDAGDADHEIAPFHLTVSAAEGWAAAKAAVSEQPRTEIVVQTEDYLHAESHSALFGYVDDLELHLRPGEGLIAVRSASRLGYGDMGVNRQRIEALRAALVARGVVR